MSVAADPSLCDCGTEHAHGCSGHVEICSSCGWSGGNGPGRPCTQCGELAVIVRGCAAWPVRGAPVCVAHGGAAKQVQKAARRRLRIAAADKALRDLDYDPIGDPVEALADAAGQVRSLVEWAAAPLAELANNDLSYASEQGIEQLRSQVALFERFMDRLGRMLNDLAKLGLEERRTAVEAAKVQLVAEALRLALTDAGVDQPQRVLEAFAVRARELETVNSEPPK